MGVDGGGDLGWVEDCGEGYWERLSRGVGVGGRGARRVEGGADGREVAVEEDGVKDSCTAIVIRTCSSVVSRSPRPSKPYLSQYP